MLINTNNSSGSVPENVNPPSTPASDAPTTQSAQSTTTTAPPKKKRKSAAIWNYFQTAVRNDKHVNKCIKCKKIYSINSGNGTLLAHAQTHGYLLDQGNRRQSFFTPSGVISNENNVPFPRTDRDSHIAKHIINLV